MSLVIEHTVALDDTLIAVENKKLRNPFFGGITSVFAMLTDDHSRHIKAHLKYWYNPATWLHIHQHYMQLKIKRKMGIEHVTNDSIVAHSNQQHQQVEQQTKQQAIEQIMEDPDPKDPKWN